MFLAVSSIFELAIIRNDEDIQFYAAKSWISINIDAWPMVRFASGLIFHFRHIVIKFSKICFAFIYPMHLLLDDEYLSSIVKQILIFRRRLKVFIE